MKILLIHQYYKSSNPTGGVRFNEMTRLWVELGHEVTVVTGSKNAEGGQKSISLFGSKLETINNVKVLRCYVSSNYNKNFKWRLWAYVTFVISGLFGSLVKLKDKYDVVLVSSPPLFVGLIGILISKFKRTPMVFEVRDLWPESAIDMGVLRNPVLIKMSYFLERFIYRNSILVNALTPAFVENLVQLKGLKPDKVSMIPNGCDYDLVEAAKNGFDREKLRLELGWAERTVFIYMGAHGLANGLDQVLDVAARVKDTNALFVLVGNGMKKNHLISRAQNEKLENVSFFNPMPKREVLRHVMSSDVGMSVLQKNDTFKTVYSNKTFDYFSCGVPVLMVIDGVSKDLVEEANAGYYVQPENIDDFEVKVRYSILNKEQMRKMGENGVDFVLNNFDRRILAEKYIEVISRRI